MGLQLSRGMTKGSSLCSLEGVHPSVPPRRSGEHRAQAGSRMPPWRHRRSRRAASWTRPSTMLCWSSGGALGLRIEGHGLGLKLRVWGQVILWLRAGERGWIGDARETSRGEPAIGAEHRAATLYSVDPRGPDQEAVIGFSGEAPRQTGPFCRRHMSHSSGRVTVTSDRYRLGVASPRPQGEAMGWHSTSI